MPTDLNKLRDLIQENQSRGEILPTSPKKQIVVTSDGRISTRDREHDDTEISQVRQDKFAMGKVADDFHQIRRKLPSTARLARVDEQEGLFFSFTDEFNNLFEFWLSYENGYYYSQVVFPVLTPESVSGSVHQHHIFFNSQNKLCLGYSFKEFGVPHLEDAYTKSVLWANGFSVYQLTGTFPFGNA